MTALKCAGILLALWPGLSAKAWSQPAVAGAITGRITMGGRPVPRAHVVLEPYGSPPGAGTLPKAFTDDEGRYRLSGVPEGRYQVRPFAPAFVLEEKRDWVPPGILISSSRGWEGIIVTVARGEVVEGVDFSLAPGGAITGRVTDARGRPVIGASVTCHQAREQGHLEGISAQLETDDRGVYRAYGLPPGRYLVGVRSGGSQLIFHPDTVALGRASYVEVAAGGEVENIDIRLGEPEKKYSFSGRVVDADTGQPVPEVTISIRGSSIQAFLPTDSKGEFLFEHGYPGRYSVGVSAAGGQIRGYYSDPVSFELTDAAVEGVEIKAYRGASISGTIVVEGTSDPALIARLPSMHLGVSWELPYQSLAGERRPDTRSQGTPVGADGKFEFTGLRPGKTKVYASNLPEGFNFLRIERAGGGVGDEFDLATREQVTGVRVVIAYGTGAIRGRVRVKGGALPSNTMWLLSLSRADGREVASEILDASGHFWFKGLSPGSYELSAEADYVEVPGVTPSPPPGPVRQTVMVANGIENQVTLILDLSGK